VILGHTGSGKSVLLRALLAGYSRAILVDPKGRATMADWPVVRGIAQLRDVWPVRSPRIVARVDAGGERRVWADELGALAYRTREVAVGVDEVMSIETANRPLPWLEAVRTEGRELGVTFLACSQRPLRIPLTVLTEADHFFVFQLLGRADRDLVADVIGPFAPPRLEHGFLYWRPGLTAAVECRPLDV
jgi:DNA helicase HerA-like ATPase